MRSVFSKELEEERVYLILKDPFVTEPCPKLFWWPFPPPIG
jgi:hypothetical protein